MDVAFIAPFMIPWMQLFLKNPQEFVREIFRGFFKYAIIIGLFAICNYLLTYDNIWFSNFLFLKRVAKILLLFPAIKAVVLSFDHKSVMTSKYIRYYSYVTLISVYAHEFAFFFFNRIEIFPVINDNGVYRFSAFMAEPSYLALLSLSMMVSLLFLEKRKIEASTILAFSSATFISRSFSFFILVFLLIFFGHLYIRKIIWDKKQIKIIFTILLSSFITDFFHKKENKFGYYKMRFINNINHKDGSTNARIVNPLKITISLKEYPYRKIGLLGVGLGQSSKFLKHFQEKTNIMTRNVSRGIHNLIIVIILEMGLLITTLIFLLFINIKNPLNLLLLLLISIVTGSYASLPIFLCIFFVSYRRMGSYIAKPF